MAPKLSVIMGGAGESLPYRFIEGEVTDTRLMGVLGMHLHWDLPEAKDSDVHQFFYYDVEELGLDQLAVYRGNEKIAVELACKSCFGGFGGKMVPIEENEARWLAHHFVEDTRKKGEILPDTLYEINFILDNPAELSEEQIFSLGQKMCTPRRTDYAAVHYFLMRLFGQDPEGAALLASPSLDMEKCRDICIPGGATFLMNTISKQKILAGPIAYLSESLVEADDGHWMVFTEVSVMDKKVVDAALKTKFRVTATEASLKLRKSEYISVFEISADEEFDREFSNFSIGTTATAHESGTMYMEFKPDNRHVEQRVFTLSDDIEALYFVTEYGQMIVAAYSYESIIAAEARIAISGMRNYIYPTNKYKFLDSVLYEFAQSGYDDFNEFVRTIQVE
ncbi:MAG: hypothetical protein IKI65_03760 [Firmicutes bacterium]|nr:hypothetical protein [Bacillota bacterium]